MAIRAIRSPILSIGIEVHSLPETRNNVERVLENLEVYRNRLSNSIRSSASIADLYRANPTGMTNIRQANSCGSASGTPMRLSRLRPRFPGHFRAMSVSTSGSYLSQDGLRLFYRDYPTSPQRRRCSAFPG
jgi:hypothetical protein